MVILRPNVYGKSGFKPEAIYDPHNVYGKSGFKPGAIYEVLYRQMGSAFPQTSAQLWRIAQLVEPLTEKPNAILTRVQVPGAERDFSTKVSFRCKLSYGVRTAPVCNRMLQHLCACSKFPVLAAIPLFGHTTILHTLIGMGSAALAADASYSSKTIRISCTGQCNTGRKLRRPKGRKGDQSDSVHSQGCSQDCSNRMS